MSHFVPVNGLTKMWDMVSEAHWLAFELVKLPMLESVSEHSCMCSSQNSLHPTPSNLQPSTSCTAECVFTLPIWGARDLSAPLGLIPNNAVDICSTTSSVNCTLWNHMSVVLRIEENMSALTVSCCLNGERAGVLKFKQSSMCQSPLGPKELSDICGQLLLWCVCVFGCVKMQFSL